VPVRDTQTHTHTPTNKPVAFYGPIAPPVPNAHRIHVMPCHVMSKASRGLSAAAVNQKKTWQYIFDYNFGYS